MDIDSREGAMKRVARFGHVTLLALLLGGCGGEELLTEPGELVETEPPDLVTGTVIAADSALAT